MTFTAQYCTIPKWQVSLDMVIYEDISVPFRSLNPFEPTFSPVPRPPSKSLFLIYKLNGWLHLVLHQTAFPYKRASKSSNLATYSLTKVTSHFQIVQLHQDTMSNGKNWPSYLATFDDPSYVEHYLSNGKYGTSGRVYFEGLMKDTDTSRPPTREWYKLHLIAVTRDEIQTAGNVWTPEVIAWGLNIWESDLIHLQRSLMQKFACLRCERSITDFDSYSLVEAAYKCMRGRFSLSPNPLEVDYEWSPLKIDHEWRITAMYRIAMDCWKNALCALDCGYYNKTDGRLTEIGDTFWQGLSAHAAKNDRSHELNAATVSHKRVMEDNEGERFPKRPKLDAEIASHKRVMEDDEGERSRKRSKTTQYTA